MRKIINNRTCGTEFIYSDNNLLGPIVINISNNSEDYITIGETQDIGTNYWDISLLEPKYIDIHGDPMTVEEKLEFIKIISSDWDNIINKLEYGCTNLCCDDKYICPHYLNRKILSHPPDYTLLEQRV